MSDDRYELDEAVPSWHAWLVEFERDFVRPLRAAGHAYPPDVLLLAFQLNEVGNRLSMLLERLGGDSDGEDWKRG